MTKYIAVILFCMISFRAFSQASSRIPGTIGSFGAYDQYGMQSFNIANNSISAINVTESTSGKRFFFDEWVRGSMTTNSEKKINTEDFYFNYDKVDNRLIASKDKKEVIEVNSESIREIHFMNKGIHYDFVKEEKINPSQFVQQLQKNDLLSLYKTINTIFVKANFETDGVAVSGNPYDEYVDAPTYFICYKGAFRPVTLKFGSIKKALKEESKKVIEFYVNHQDVELDENYLINLVIYIDK